MERSVESGFRTRSSHSVGFTPQHVSFSPSFRWILIPLDSFFHPVGMERSVESGFRSPSLHSVGMRPYALLRSHSYGMRGVAAGRFSTERCIPTECVLFATLRDTLGGQLYTTNVQNRVRSSRCFMRALR